MNTKKTNTDLLIPYRKGDKWGFCDRNKNIIIPVKYDNVDIRDYMECENKKLIKVKLGEKWGIIDEVGREIIPTKYDDVKSTFVKGKGLIQIKLEDSWGVIDTKGRKITPVKYNDIKYYGDDLVAVRLGNKWGMINRTGKEIIPIKYDDISSFSMEGDLFWVRLNEKYGLLDKIGKEVTSMKYDYYNYVLNFSFSRLILVGLNNKWGVMDNYTGKEIIPVKYERIDGFNWYEVFGGKLVRVKLNEKVGYVSTDGVEYWED